MTSGVEPHKIVNGARTTVAQKKTPRLRESVCLSD